MKRIYRQLGAAAFIATTAIGLSVLNVLPHDFFAAPDQASATLYGRRNKNDVIPPDWVGRWQCNLDGRPAIIDIQLGNTYTDNGDGTVTFTHSTKIYGQVKDRGQWKNLEQRSFNSNDLSTPHNGHLL